ncbi:uncharacterized protein C2845_PM03G16000 [Panicum miliaceum]|uniref:Ultraviolet-B-repressible protein n=1 Tax=Panicum miliaceum TaxID=4540 RepID=A0A3L6T5I3_PANMI|nr:uncharacterized protein C2845_PM03G16000 [Panicum miliaceum]
MARPQHPTSDSSADLARRTGSSLSTQATLTFSKPTMSILTARRLPRATNRSRPPSCAMATASLSAVASPLSVAGLRKPLGAAASSFQPLQPRARPAARMAVRASAASMKEKAAAGLTAAAVAAALMMPDVAEAAQLTPSLKNFLLSIVSGGVVLVAIVGAVVAVSNFDPVKRA